MIGRSLTLSTLLVCASLAPAQAPVTVTAEGVASVAVKPDHAKIYLTVETKAGDAAASAEANHAARKDLVAAMEKLSLKGVTWATLPQKVTKDKPGNNQFGVVVAPGGAPQQAPPDSYSTMQTVIYSVSESDHHKLGEAVEKITQAAAAQGITGDKAQADNSGLNPFMSGTKNGARVVYSSKSGWDGPMAKGLALATEKALANAAAIAKGAGMGVQQVVSIDELGEAAPAPAAVASNPYLSLFGGASASSDDEYSDGELVRKVRVRVKVTVAK